MILVSFCRILNGLSDEINLFWRCSSPLKATILLDFERKRNRIYTEKDSVNKEWHLGEQISGKH